MLDKWMTTNLDAEDIAYWYLRLNGFLCLRNFLVHGDRRGEIRTDIDVVGVRMKHRREHLKDPMRDAEWVEDAKRTIVVFCDAKTNARDFNAAWTLHQRYILESFLALVGAVPENLWAQTARELYETGRSEPSPDVLVTVLLVNHDPRGQAPTRLRSAQVIQLADAFRFVHRRFNKYRQIKRENSQWEASGHALWNLFEKHRRSEDAFVIAGLRAIGSDTTRLLPSSAS